MGSTKFSVSLLFGILIALCSIIGSEGRCLHDGKWYEDDDYIGITSSGGCDSDLFCIGGEVQAFKKEADCVENISTRSLVTVDMKNFDTIIESSCVTGRWFWISEMHYDADGVICQKLVECDNGQMKKSTNRVCRPRTDTAPEEDATFQSIVVDSECGDYSFERSVSIWEGKKRCGYGVHCRRESNGFSASGFNCPSWAVAPL